MRATDSEPHKTENIHVCGETISVLQSDTPHSAGLGGAPVTQDHNQKLLPPLASFILLPALIEGEMSQQRTHTHTCKCVPVRAYRCDVRGRVI